MNKSLLLKGKKKEGHFCPVIPVATTAVWRCGSDSGGEQMLSCYAMTEL